MSIFLGWPVRPPGSHRLQPWIRPCPRYATCTAPLFRSELQLRILGLLLLNADERWTTNELARRLDATPLAVHRELHRALDAGLVAREAIGRTYIYRVVRESPLYEPLALLLERTVGVEPELRRVLEDIPGVDAAFIHGSFATKEKIRPSSERRVRAR